MEGLICVVTRRNTLESHQAVCASYPPFMTTCFRTWRLWPIWPLKTNRKILQYCIKTMAHPGLKSGLQAARPHQELSRQRCFVGDDATEMSMFGRS
ncbi:rCG26393 [Rattus norvegicus]|uniref:RCG26393 n=1 Tax=Rattus norvegicus TaxID=10116 RepID=A6HP98_RAT|nr:rCG26393 [Rattus norvegicus]